jgi:hypothetical protein
MSHAIYHIVLIGSCQDRDGCDRGHNYFCNRFGSRISAFCRFEGPQQKRHGGFAPACEGGDQTGSGAVRILGNVTRGFMYAGASRIVASLRKVDDFATGELMKLSEAYATSCA